MNKQNRADIQKAIDFMSKARDILIHTKDAEQEKIDNLPESLQDTDRASKMQDVVDTCETSVDNLESDMSELENLIND